MTYEEFDHFTNGISAIFTALAIVIGGVWTYRRFIRTREAHPKIEFEVDVSFVRRQSGYWIVEALAFVDNKGLVRHNIQKFVFDLRYTLPSDPIEKKDTFLVYVPHEAAQGSWLPLSWDQTFIEPGVHTRYSCLAAIPEGATTVLIHGKFYYPNGDWHTSDKLVTVPSTPTYTTV